MKNSKFCKMSPAELEAYRPRDEDDHEALAKEKDFREWCNENEENYEDDDSRKNYHDFQRETGQGFWDDLDEDDREGWEHNIIKSFDD